MMGATIVMVAAVAMVLSLVLLLLAELYCTLLLRKRRRHPNTTLSPTSTPTAAAAAPSLCSFYAQGVIHAPRSFLFPTAPPQEDPNSERQLIFHNNLRYSSSARIDHRGTASPDSTSTSGGGAEQLIYICNPMYDGEEAIIGNNDTPFETPATSPSNLDIETGSSSSSGGSSPPQLTPMKKLLMCTTPSESNTIFGGASSSSSSASPSTSPSW